MDGHVGHVGWSAGWHAKGYVSSKYYLEVYDKKSYVTNKEVYIDIKRLGIVGL